MAKQLVGPIERHIEKAVLGIVGLGLMGAIALYLATSPNKIDIDGEMVGPGQIAEKIYQKAEDVRGRISRTRPEEDTFEPLYGEFEEEITSIAKADVNVDTPRALRFSPSVPVVDKVGVKKQDRQLVEILPLGQPAVISGRSDFVVETESGDERVITSTWVTVSAEFPIREQTEKQALQYGTKRSEVVFAPAEMQRRMMRNDGSWSDDDWEMIDTWPREKQFDNPPVVKLVQEDGIWTAPTDVFKPVDAFFKFLRESQVQLAVLRPLMPFIRVGDTWDVPVNSSRLAVLQQDAYYLYYGAEKPNPPDDRYGGPAVKVDKTDPNPTKITPGDLLDESRRLLKLARDTCSDQDAVKAYNRAFDVVNGDASRGEKSQAQNLMTDVANFRADLKRGRCRPAGTSAATEGETVVEVMPVQQIWAHDARPGSIKDGRTYQYRIRPVVFNRLAAQPGMFGDPQLAKTVLIRGPWSEPTGPVTLQDSQYYYVVSNDDRDDEVTVEFYRWFEGVWVKARTQFTPGKPLDCKRRCEVPAWNDPGSVEKPLVAFETGMLVVDIDHNREHRARKRAGRGAVAFEDPSPQCSVVLLGPDGRLQERFVSTDKNDPGKSINGSRVFKKRVGTK
ncbi:MAG: hypothetical protein ACYTHJ_09010 [Planctomycetota bacterium]|jgi:hypothetical protein